MTIKKSIDGNILLEAHKQLPYDKLVESPLPFYGDLNKLKFSIPRKNDSKLFCWYLCVQFFV
jgi:hypothetical protein